MGCLGVLGGIALLFLVWFFFGPFALVVAILLAILFVLLKR